MNILFLSRWYPDPPDNGSKLRIFHLLRQLSEVYTVDLISFTSEPPDPEKGRGLSTFCRKIWTAEYIPFQPGKLGGLSGLFSSTPRSVTATFSAEMDQLVKTAVSENRYDVDADMRIEDFFEELDIDDRDFDDDNTTLGGWAIEQLGRYPRVGDRFRYKNLTITVVKKHKLRVMRLIVEVEPPAPDEDDD